MEKRITEQELVLPSLYLMYSLNKHIRTDELIKRLTELMHPTGIDAEILANRKDTHFSQIVRNLKSHNTFSRNGYATYVNGEYQITVAGSQYVEKNIDNLKYLFTTDFAYSDIKEGLNTIKTSEKIQHFYEFVSEGEARFYHTKSYERSKKLRDYAIEHFSHNGLIVCNCCGFEFKSFYGERFGKSGIEIHHMKPIFMYGGVSVKQTIDKALENLLPVCPNCHRVIHKNSICASMIPDFKETIRLQKSL